MTKLEQIEKSVTELDKQEFEAFRRGLKPFRPNAGIDRWKRTPRAASSIVSRRRP
ncbi:hypothetical protein AMC78_CH03343 [Rhizobium phaseoli]|nr:hypothetical protein AMC78_CH03343 [Rhizobium phaseoli]